MAKPVPSFISELPEYLVFEEEDRSIVLADIVYPKKTVHRASWLQEHLPYSFTADWQDFINKVLVDEKEWYRWVAENISCWCYARVPNTTFHFMNESEMMLFKLRWG